MNKYDYVTVEPRAVIAYCRVSSREQEEGYSLDAQLKNIINYAEKNNLQILKHWQVAESAKKEGRKAFSEMINYLTEHNNIQIAVIEKIDRVARNFADIVKVYDLIKAGKEFHFVKEGIILNNDSRSNELMNFDLQAVMAKGYINNLRDDVKKGLEGKVAQGGWPASAPLGYKK